MPTIVNNHQSTTHHHYNHQQQKPIKQQTQNIIKTQSSHQILPDTVARYHTRHSLAPNKTTSSITQHIDAPLSTVWSLLRQFETPQTYKHFLKSCQILKGDGQSIGALRQVNVVSGLPAATSTERLDILDDDRFVIGFSVVDGDHRLLNYKSVTTLHSSGTETVVVESYEVDVPEENSKEDTCVFVDTIVRCNLQSLAKIAQSQSLAAASAARG